MSYRIDDSKSKIVLSVESSSMRELFADAARGLFDAMYDASSIRGGRELHVTVDARSESDLFSAWLARLLEEVGSQKIVFSEFEVVSIQKISSTQYLLTAVVFGEDLDKKKHKLKREVKKVGSVKGSCSSDGKKCSYSCVLS